MTALVVLFVHEDYVLTNLLYQDFVKPPPMNCGHIRFERLGGYFIIKYLLQIKEGNPVTDFCDIHFEHSNFFHRHILDSMLNVVVELYLIVQARNGYRQSEVFWLGIKDETFLRLEDLRAKP